MARGLSSKPGTVSYDSAREYFKTASIPRINSIEYIQKKSTSSSRSNGMTSSTRSGGSMPSSRRKRYDDEYRESKSGKGKKRSMFEF